MDLIPCEELRDLASTPEVSSLIGFIGLGDMFQIQGGSQFGSK